jgi:hypothetical protein
MRHLALALILAATPAVAAQHEDTPTMEADGTAAGSQPQTFRTEGKPDAGVMGRADMTLRALVEDPHARIGGATYLLEGLRVTGIERVRGAEHLYVVALDEPRTGASTSSFVRVSSGSVNVIFPGDELRAMLDRYPALARFPARVRLVWTSVEEDGFSAYAARIISVEWLDDEGRLVREAHGL